MIHVVKKPRHPKSKANWLCLLRIMPNSAQLNELAGPLRDPNSLQSGVKIAASLSNREYAGFWRYSGCSRVEVDVVRMLRMVLALVVALGVVVPIGADGQTSTVLVVTGSSMPEPLYLLWNDEYHKQQPNVQLRYLAEGSGAGAERAVTGSGDFSGGDAPIPEKELKNAKVRVVELPTVLIGIVVIYNLPGTSGELHLSGPVLANIFLGKITSWNDPAIAKLNPELPLRAIPVQVVHRTPGKGSSYILSDFLAKESPEFLARAGRSESPNWPVGVNAGRSQDMIEKVQATPGAIGYTELNLAEKNSLRMASIKNSAGEFVRPSVRTISAAASAAAKPRA